MRSTHAWAVVAVALIGCGGRTALSVETQAAAPTRDAAADVAIGDAGTDAIAEASMDSAPDAPNLDCPRTPPTSGAACANVGQICTYLSDLEGRCSLDGFAATLVWSCSVDGWSNAASCIDQSRCPDAMPADGASCGALVDGSECFYSTVGCDPGGVAQCSNGHFHATNDCGARTLDGCALTVSADQTLAPTGTLTDPLLSLVGVQAFVGARVDDGSTDGPSLHLDVLQVVGPRALASIPATSTSIVAPVPTLPSLTSLQDAWYLVDPNVAASTSDDLEIYDLGATLVRGSAFATSDAPTSIALAPQGGWVSFRGASEAAGFQRATLRPFDAMGGTFFPVGTGDVVADESKTPAPGVPPVAQALAAVARTKIGFVVAYSVPASGDLLDDSGVEIVFIDDPTARLLPPEAGNAFRVDAGGVGQIAIAPMRDGAVVLATTPFTPATSSLPTSIALTRITRDGALSTLTPQTVSANQGIGTGVALAPLDDGFVLAFQILGVDPSTGLPTSSVNVIPYAAAGTPTANSVSIGRTLTTDSPIALATAPIDRTVHFAFIDEGGAPNRLEYGRMFCQR